MTTMAGNVELSRQRAFLNLVLVYILIFTSGSLRYNQSNDKFLVLAFVVVLLAWIIYTDRKISSGFLLYCFVFSGLLYALSLYTDGSLSLSAVISSTLKLILAYMVIRTVAERFTVTYVKVVVFLAAISLIGNISDNFQLFDGLVSKLPVIPGRGHDGIFYIFRDTYHPFRNQSIFFEPGAYQAFLNAALFIIFFTSPDIEKRRQWVYITILLAALVSAFSTTGFIIFMIGFVLFLFKSDIATSYGKLVLIGVSVVTITIFAAQFHQRFVQKINDYLTAEEFDFSWSAQTRSSQLKADIRVIKKHIFGLGLKEYLKEFKLEGRTDNRGSSNGITKIIAVYGMPFALFIYGSYLWAIRRLVVDPVLVAGAFIMFVLFLAGEAYYTSTPISYALIAAAFVCKREPVNEELLMQAE